MYVYSHKSSKAYMGKSPCPITRANLQHPIFALYPARNILHTYTNTILSKRHASNNHIRKLLYIPLFTSTCPYSSAFCFLPPLYFTLTWDFSSNRTLNIILFPGLIMFYGINCAITDSIILMT